MVPTKVPALIWVADRLAPTIQGPAERPATIKSTSPVLRRKDEMPSKTRIARNTVSNRMNMVSNDIAELPPESEPDREKHENNAEDEGGLYRNAEWCHRESPPKVLRYQKNNTTPKTARAAAEVTLLMVTTPPSPYWATILDGTLFTRCTSSWRPPRVSTLVTDGKTSPVSRSPSGTRISITILLAPGWVTATSG